MATKTKKGLYCVTEFGVHSQELAAEYKIMGIKIIAENQTAFEAEMRLAEFEAIEEDHSYMRCYQKQGFINAVRVG